MQSSGLTLACCVLMLAAGIMGEVGRLRAWRDGAASKIRPRRQALTYMLVSNALHGSTIGQGQEAALEAIESNGLEAIESNGLEAQPGPPASYRRVDLSGDTRVNYLRDARGGRSNLLARERDAEVFDWELMERDRAEAEEGLRKEEEEGRGYQRIGGGMRRSGEDEGTINQRVGGSVSDDLLARGRRRLQEVRRRMQQKEDRRYFQALDSIRRRPATGLVSSADGQGVTRFNRQPIVYEQTREYQRDQQRRRS